MSITAKSAVNMATKHDDETCYERGCETCCTPKQRIEQSTKAALGN